MLNANNESCSFTGARRIFSKGGQWGGLKDESPPAESRDSSPVEVWGQSTQKLTTFSNWCINTCAFWDVRQHLQHKKLQPKTILLRSEGGRTDVVMHATEMTWALAIKLDSNSVFLMQLMQCVTEWICCLIFQRWTLQRHACPIVGISHRLFHSRLDTRFQSLSLKKIFQSFILKYGVFW